MRRSIERAMKGIRFLVHVAADYRLWARHPEDIVRTNVEGTRLGHGRGAARRGRAHRLYLKRRHAWRRGRMARPSDETLSARREVRLSAPTNTAKSRPSAWSKPWSRSKTCRRSSSILRRRSGRATFAPRRRDASSSRRRRAACPALSIPASTWSMSTTSPPGIWRRCATAASASATFSAGRMFCSATCSPRSRACVGRSPPKLRLPRALIFPIAYGAEAIAHFTGREPFVTTTGLRLAKDHMFFTSAKAERELGYRARPIAKPLPTPFTGFGKTAISNGLSAPLPRRSRRK